MWYINNSKTNHEVDLSFYKFAQSQLPKKIWNPPWPKRKHVKEEKPRGGKFEVRQTPNGTSLGTWFEPKIYWDFATQTFNNKLATMKNNSMALLQTLDSTGAKMKQNLETQHSQTWMLSEIRKDLLKVAPAQNQDQMQMIQQQRNQIFTKLYQDGITMIRAMKQKSMPNDQIKKDIIDTKLLNLLNSGQINKELYEDLEYRFTTEISKPT